jgi:hypothetical protein
MKALTTTLSSGRRLFRFGKTVDYVKLLHLQLTVSALLDGPATVEPTVASSYLSGV